MKKTFLSKLDFNNLTWKQYMLKGKNMTYIWKNKNHSGRKEGPDGVRTRDLRFTRPTPYHLATEPIQPVIL